MKVEILSKDDVIIFEDNNKKYAVDSHVKPDMRVKARKVLSIICDLFFVEVDE